MPRVVFQPSEVAIDVESETSILVAATEAGQTATPCCGISPSCGKCVTDVLEGLENLSPPDALESKHIARYKFPPYRRLGCMAHIRGDVELEVIR
jgi:adenylate cyclase